MTLGSRFRFGLGGEILNPLLAQNANKPRAENLWGEPPKNLTRAKQVKITQLWAHLSPSPNRISS